jgi:prepilin-type processing-associated H-X9-DG protein
VALGAIDSPADTIIFADTNVGSGYPDWWINPATGADYAAAAMVAANCRHNEGRNYAFVDGHSKWLKAPPANMFTCAAD